MTRAPAPAATTAAVVLTLKVLCPSPPVPTMSTMKSSSARSTIALLASERRTWAAVAKDSGLRSRRERWRAVRKAPICVSATASGVKTCSRARRKSDGEKYSGVLTSLLSSGLNVSEENVDMPCMSRTTV